MGSHKSPLPHDTGSDPPTDRSPSFPRRRSNNGITIEEISDDDFAYDGDIEIVRPDQYEEVDSNTGGVDSPLTFYQDATYWQIRLAEKLTALNCNSDTNESHDNTDRPPSRKRRSREPANDAGADETCRRLSAGVEVVEVKDGSDVAPRVKRRRRKSRRSKTSERIIHRLPVVTAKVRDKGKSSQAALTTSESSDGTPSSPHTPIKDAMDID